MNRKYKNISLLEPCCDYLGCGQRECIMFNSKEGHFCWDLHGTLCNHHGIRMLRNKSESNIPKREICKKNRCIYFEAAQKLGLVSEN